jgi:hypothetical protein
MEGFKETVSEAWNKQLQATDPIRRFHIKLSRTAKALKKWQRTCIGDLRKQIAMAKEIIWRLDQAKEYSEEEIALRRQLKSSYLGLLSIQKIKLRQRSRLTWIRLGDANTKLFHARVNGRRRKVYIQSLTSDSGTAITAKDKEEILAQHFKSILGTSAPRQLVLDWLALDYVPQDLSDLDADFDEEEIKEAVFSLPSVKAPDLTDSLALFTRHVGISSRTTLWLLLSTWPTLGETAPTWLIQRTSSSFPRRLTPQGWEITGRSV